MTAAGVSFPDREGQKKKDLGVGQGQMVNNWHGVLF